MNNKTKLLAGGMRINNYMWRNVCPHIRIMISSRIMVYDSIRNEIEAKIYNNLKNEQS
jgi:hypothetical protein